MAGSGKPIDVPLAIATAMPIYPGDPDVDIERAKSLKDGDEANVSRLVLGAHTEAFVFSRESFAWVGLDREWIVAIPPSIDVFSPKNEQLDPARVAAGLRATGVVAGTDPGPATSTRCHPRLRRARVSHDRRPSDLCRAGRVRGLRRSRTKAWLDQAVAFWERLEANEQHRVHLTRCR
jgi:hypothetical protein